MDKFFEIFRTDQPELEKVTRGFDFITQQIILNSSKEMELLTALKDNENLLKEQIKCSTVEHLRKAFAQCYLLATGKKAWNDEK